jgi:hypothetical protein
METISSTQINQANDLLETILIELTSYFDNPISSDLLQIHDNGIKLLLKWYPTFSTILRTMLTYYNLPASFKSNVQQSNTSFRLLRLKLRKLSFQLGLELHPIIE